MRWRGRGAERRSRYAPADRWIQDLRCTVRSLSGKVEIFDSGSTPTFPDEPREARRRSGIQREEPPRSGSIHPRRQPTRTTRPFSSRTTPPATIRSACG